MELAVYNIKGEDTGRKVNLNDEIFAIAEPNEHAVYLDVKQYLANKRQGTHKAKERSEIAGSTKKLGRQKGGGGARHGDINSPLFHGGGRVFGPRPRNYGFKLNKKVKALARRSALTYKAPQDQGIRQHHPQPQARGSEAARRPRWTRAQPVSVTAQRAHRKRDHRQRHQYLPRA